MSTSKHTELPWKADGKLVLFIDPDDGTVYQPATAWDAASGTAKANADFIVLACNSHDALLEALDECVKTLDSLPFTAFKERLRSSVIRSSKKAHAALESARGEGAPA